MKMVKSLILGSAAGLVAMSGAQAADLPVKAKAVEYVRICSCMVLVSSTSQAPTPASSWVVICALKPRSIRTLCTTALTPHRRVPAIGCRTTTRAVPVRT